MNKTIVTIIAALLISTVAFYCGSYKAQHSDRVMIWGHYSYSSVQDELAWMRSSLSTMQVEHYLVDIELGRGNSYDVGGVALSASRWDLAYQDWEETSRHRARNGWNLQTRGDRGYSTFLDEDVWTVSSDFNQIIIHLKRKDAPAENLTVIDYD